MCEYVIQNANSLRDCPINNEYKPANHVLDGAKAFRCMGHCGHDTGAGTVVAHTRAHAHAHCLEGWTRKLECHLVCSTFCAVFDGW